MKASVIGIMSFKGGVGKTVCAINVAAALVRKKKKVLIIDGNFLSPTLNIYLGLLNPEITLKEVIRNDLLVEDAIYEHRTGIHVMPCRFYKDINLDKFKKTIEILRGRYDFIILDSGPSYTEEIIAVLMVSDEIIFITTPDYPTLVSTLRAAELTKNKELNVRGIIVNKKRKNKFELNIRDIEETTGLPVIAEIFDDNKIMKAASKFMPITHYEPRNKNSKIFLRVAEILIDDGLNEDEMELAKLLKGIKIEEGE